MVIDMVMHGLSPVEMAKRLHIQRRTVKARMNRLYRYFEIDDRWAKHVRLIYILSRRGIKPYGG